MRFSANDMEALQNESLVAKPFLLEHFNRETTSAWVTFVPLCTHIKLHFQKFTRY